MNIDEIITLINNAGTVDEILNIIKDLHPRDIALALLELNDDKQDLIIDSLKPDELADVLSFIDSDDSSEILEDIAPEKVASILEEMEADDAQDVLEEMDETLVSKIKKHLDKETLEDIEIVSKYEEGTAGALMNPNFIKILKDTSVKDAFKLITKEAPDAEIIDTLFVVDEKDTLLGVLDLKKLIAARMPLTVCDIMLENYIACETSDGMDIVTKKVRDYDVKALPVLENGIILGIITMDDAFEAFTDEAEEDYAKLAGLTEDEEENESVFSSLKKRLPWLAILLLLDVVVALVISSFDDVISSLTILTFFQTAVLGLSGNCGTQSLAVSVRRLSQEKENNHLLKHLGKELLQGFGLGIVLSLVGFLFVVSMLYIKDSSLNIHFIHQVGLVLGIAVLVSVFISNLIGTIIPIILYKLHVDPAVASGPFITTINDIISVLIYFGTALLVLSNYL